MGFLHKLWDETLAGPTPDFGLGKLRKYDSFSAVRSPPPPVIIPSDDPIPVSRSITILRANSFNLAAFRNHQADSGSLPASPAGSSTPTSPFSPSTPRGDMKRLTRRKSRPEPMESSDPTSPTIYDWIVIHALDR
ncbi:dormancy-associated protein homolog 4-like isoform X1 [Actinidia eriantha]|uniref:dormancy-associated protein homolog 4-like isoform X1 n=1 Tax=Actinidia eriantha TaxID=165200 RepID=UPI00258301A2|nr:dormancy-associated protein homolog 4-like isoform X1 [Actinidia eriantha]